PKITQDHIITSKKEIIWKLLMELFDLFKYPTNTKYRFLQTTPQMNQIGYNKLALYYENRKKRMEKLYKQEITNEEPRNTSGRRATEV
ncbi:4763_t:CDS:1, partial [Funneliformis mosseae]